MYNDTVTLFCRYEDKSGDIVWYAHILENVNLSIDRAAIIAKYGAQSQDNAALNVGYTTDSGAVMVSGTQWLPPKEWAGQSPEARVTSLTFAAGNDYSVIMAGVWDGPATINDDDYGVNGFYDYLNRKIDNVFTVTTVTKYGVIPHFEIIGK